MIPFLDVEKINHKSAIKSDISSIQEEKSDFAEIFNLLSNQTSKKESNIKTEKKDSKDSLVQEGDKKQTSKKPQEKEVDALLPSKENKNTFTKEETSKKEVVAENFAAIKQNQNQTLQSLNQHNNTQKTIKTKQETIPQNPQNPKELLEFTKAQNTPKTLKDIVELSNKMQLNLQKITIAEEKAIEEKLPLKEIIPQASLVSTKKQSKVKQNKTDNIFNAILQDKDFIQQKVKKQNPQQATIQEKNNKKETITQSPTNEILSNNLKTTTKKDSKNTLDSKEIKELNINPKEVKSENSQAEIKSVEIKSKDKKAEKQENHSIAAKTPKEETKNQSTTKQASIEIQAEKIKSNKPESTNINTETKNTANSIQENKELPKEALLNPKEVETKIQSSKNNEIEPKNSKDTKPTESQTTTNPITIKEDKESKEDKNKNSSKITKQEDKYISIKQDTKEEMMQKYSDNQIQTKEEMQKSDEQRFLDNLLKIETPQKSKQAPQITKIEEGKDHKEKNNKMHQEIYQTNIQNQSFESFNPKNTFLHFSDKLRDALQNYKPPITKISLELNPENLGSVELTITKMGDKVNIQIGSNQTALQLFMQNAQEFKIQLNNVGFNEVTMDFKDTSGNSFSQNNGGNFGNSQQQNPNQHQKRNENGLYIYKQAEESNLEISHLDLSFSYYA
ncbi:flagellar hook-length control protein FliK [Helicobacter pullorum]|uniref:flagellar hook-length control protein FliK n=1 Tax=Helicobacter pullorum TaxID=35818 RepID=UPI001DB89BB6|nr:flagellar hook-length control protein FliK [Helicobacter pullorum]HJF83249.1 flagellar hook-length control protein FliK [Helicobacter pullorum]